MTIGACMIDRSMEMMIRRVTCNILGPLDLFSYKNSHSATDFDHVAQSFVAWCLQEELWDAYAG